MMEMFWPDSNAFSLPPLRSRQEMISILTENEYGRVMEPTEVAFKVEENIIPNFCAGKAALHRVVAVCNVNGQVFQFSFHAVIPVGGKKLPFFVHINFRSSVPDRYMPTEELVDSGFAVFSFDYNDVTKDNPDFKDGLAGVIFPNGKRQGSDPGKIAMWAWAAQRVMDYAQTLGDALDMTRSVVCGHSRLGKTALWAAALDTRFAFAYSNDSGCSGAAISRGKGGETVSDICKKFPYWFCENYWQYAGREEQMPFDQHYLLASIAPRKVLVGSASEDAWADPVAEQLGCACASGAFPNGFVGPNRSAEVGEQFLEGDIGYHLRQGAHYFSREDWHKLIKFVRLHSR